MAGLGAGEGIVWFVIFVKHISGKKWGWLQLGSATEDLILAGLHHPDYCTWAVGQAPAERFHITQTMVSQVVRL